MASMWRLGPRHFSSSAIRAADSSTHYSILGISVSASAAEIKTAFYQLSKVYHPDRVRNKSEEEQKMSRLKFEEVSMAYTVLSDPAQKRDYDQQNSYRFNGGSAGGTRGNPNTGSGFHSTGMFRERPASGFNRRADKQRTSTFQGGFRTSRMKANTASSRFSGEHRDASNYDVPHFDYDKHHHQQCSYEEHRVRHQRQLDEEFREALRKKNQEREYHYHTGGTGGGIPVGATVAGLGATGVVLIAMMCR
ncbi:Chaperone protein [Yarrowia sp. C11]|nr:Chaperone protein [Yarrowia sp. C11]KAG5364376.1 Chaperone protein [Yarrowia sp. E02]